MTGKDITRTEYIHSTQRYFYYCIVNLSFNADTRIQSGDHKIRSEHFRYRSRISTDWPRAYGAARSHRRRSEAFGPLRGLPPLRDPILDRDHRLSPLWTGFLRSLKIKFALARFGPVSLKIKNVRSCAFQGSPVQTSGIRSPGITRPDEPLSSADNRVSSRSPTSTSVDRRTFGFSG